MVIAIANSREAHPSLEVVVIKATIFTRWSAPSLKGLYFEYIRSLAFICFVHKVVEPLESIARIIVHFPELYDGFFGYDCVSFTLI